MNRYIVLGCIFAFTPAAASSQVDDSLTADTLTIAVADGTDLLVATLRNGWLIEVDGGTHGALTTLYSHWEPAYDSIGASRFMGARS